MRGRCASQGSSKVWRIRRRESSNLFCRRPATRMWHHWVERLSWLPASSKDSVSSCRVQVSNEPRPINQIAPPTAVGAPARAGIAIPSRSRASSWRLVSSAREEVKCRTHAHQHRNAICPVFCIHRSCSASPNQPTAHRERRGNHGHNFLVFLWTKRTEGWRKGPQTSIVGNRALRRIRKRSARPARRHKKKMR